MFERSVCSYLPRCMVSSPKKASLSALSLVQEPQISLKNIFPYFIVLCILGIIQDHQILVVGHYSGILCVMFMNF